MGGGRDRRAGDARARAAARGGRAQPYGTTEPRPAVHAASGSPDQHPMPRHVWVTVTGVVADQHPGVLLDWRRNRAGQWEALVVWAAGGGRHAAHARIDWLAAHHVTPR